MIRQLENTSICRDPFELKAYIKKVVTYSTTDINAKDNFGNTALFYALVLKDISLIHLLCEFGADVNCNINNSSIGIIDFASYYVTDTRILDILKRRRAISSRSLGEADVDSIQLDEVRIPPMDENIALNPNQRRTIQPGPQAWLS